MGGPREGGLPLFFALGPIMFTHTCQGMLTTLPYVLGVYMVRDFLTSNDGLPPPEERVGTLTGLLGACFCAAQLLTSYPLGLLSDRLGRRPIIVFGNASCVASVIAFGLSGTYFQAVAARFAGGIFNAIIGAEKAMIGELLSPDEQAQAMGYISLTWGIGTILGPMFGGVLASPCGPHGLFRRHQEAWVCSPGSLIRQRPYLLPCIAAAAMSLIATILTAIFLEESLPRSESNEKQEYVSVPTLDEDDHIGGGSGGLIEVELPERNYKNSSRKLCAEDSARVLTPETTKNNDAAFTGPLAVDCEQGDDEFREASHVISSRPWHRQRNVILSLAGYALIAFCYVLLDELIPIFASADTSIGGLGFPTSELALPLAFGGAVLFIWAIFGFPWLMDRLGVVRACRHGLMQTVPMALLVPAASLSVLPSHAAMWVALGMKSIAGTNAFTSCIILVNTSAPKGSLGAVNGIGQTLASGVRALGPALGGLLWAWSIKLFKALGLESAWGHQFIPFGIAALIGLGTLEIYKRIELPVAEAGNAASPLE